MTLIFRSLKSDYKHSILSEDEQEIPVIYHTKQKDAVEFILSEPHNACTRDEYGQGSGIFSEQVLSMNDRNGTKQPDYCVKQLDSLI